MPSLYIKLPHVWEIALTFSASSAIASSSSIAFKSSTSQSFLLNVQSVSTGKIFPVQSRSVPVECSISILLSPAIMASFTVLWSLSDLPSFETAASSHWTSTTIAEGSTWSSSLDVCDKLLLIAFFASLVWEDYDLEEERETGPEWSGAGFLMLNACRKFGDSIRASNSILTRTPTTLDLIQTRISNK